MGTATFIREVASHYPGQVINLYRLDPPLEHEGQSVELVAVSALPGFSEPRYRVEAAPDTAMFASDESGTFAEWAMDSIVEQRGSFDHEKALAEAGYEVAK